MQQQQRPPPPSLFFADHDEGAELVNLSLLTGYEKRPLEREIASFFRVCPQNFVFKRFNVNTSKEEEANLCNLLIIDERTLLDWERVKKVKLFKERRALNIFLFTVDLDQCESHEFSLYCNEAPRCRIVSSAWMNACVRENKIIFVGNYDVTANVVAYLRPNKKKKIEKEEETESPLDYQNKKKKKKKIEEEEELEAQPVCQDKKKKKVEKEEEFPGIFLRVQDEEEKEEGLPIVYITYTRGCDRHSNRRTRREVVIIKKGLSREGNEIVHFVPLEEHNLWASSLNPQPMKTATSKFGEIAMTMPHGYAIN